MLTVLLALTTAAAVEVPYVPQTRGLCGGAAVAMVFRYWGDTHAGVEQFAPLVDRRAGGIADDVLVDAVKSRGWEAFQFQGSVELLQQHLAARQPIIVLLSERRDRYHYVVVTAMRTDGIVVHDPSWGPSHTIRSDEFQRRWSAARFWSLAISPSRDLLATRRDAGAPSIEESADKNPTACQSLLDRAVADVQTRGLSEADAILARVRTECPHEAGPVRELAGVRYGQRRWRDAVALARDALTIDPTDRYALDLLGSSLFMLDDAGGALRAWNQIGKPRFDSIRIDGLHHSRYEAIAEAIGANREGVLTERRFAMAQRRLDDLPDRTGARLRLRPDADGFAALDATILERSTIPHGPIEWAAAWAAAGLHAAADREVSLSLPGSTGQGDLWTASWRWWTNRPRVAIEFAAPRFAGLPGVWRVDASWETETFALGSSAAPAEWRQSRTHGGFTVEDWLTPNLRYTIGAGLDAWTVDGRSVESLRSLERLTLEDEGSAQEEQNLVAARKAASVAASIERRLLRDRLSIAAGATKWFSTTEAAGFSSLGLRLSARSLPSSETWGYAATAGVQRVSDSAPIAVWPGAGDGHARPALLRAHPLLNDGIVDARGQSAFGRSLISSSVEGQRWFARPSLLHVGMAMFVDAAQAWRRDFGLAAENTNAGSTIRVDAGVGLRVRLPGSERMFRVDVARGLADRATAVTIGWTF
jgi:peptidase C39-like protein